MFRLTALISLLSSAAALRADSQEGQALLAKSRSLDDANSWVMNYSIVFQSCHTVSQYVSDGGQDEQVIQYRNLVKYKLCPSKKCRYGCTGAEYLTDMDMFVDAYTEWQMNEKEYKCEQIRENCNCNYYYGDDEACENKCYSDAGMSDCIEQRNDDDGAFNFDLQEWLECKESEAYDGYGNVLYVGPKCSESGEQINLGVFSDQYCTEAYSNEIFAKYYNGNILPYQDENIVAENCVACKRAAENNNNGYYNKNNYEMVEMCEEIYPDSMKCESKLAKYLSYPVTNGCEYISNIKLYEKGYKPVSGAASTFFAVVFGLSTIALAGFAAHLYQLNARKIELSTDAAVV